MVSNPAAPCSCAHGHGMRAAAASAPPLHCRTACVHAGRGHHHTKLHCMHAGSSSSPVTHAHRSRCCAATMPCYRLHLHARTLRACSISSSLARLAVVARSQRHSTAPAGPPQTTHTGRHAASSCLPCPARARAASCTRLLLGEPTNTHTGHGSVTHDDDHVGVGERL